MAEEELHGPCVRNPLATSGGADFANPTHDSIWKVARQLKKEQLSLYNCLASVLSDAAFVSEIRALYPTLPLLANLRCGLWYTRQPDGTCYFKSTDGHNGNWSFSCTRLNLHVAELAARQGGVIVVDATRKGKRFPDAMTKTIPIWAAVINRAVARKRAEAAEAAQRQAADAAASAGVEASAAAEAAAAAIAVAASEAEEQSAEACMHVQRLAAAAALVAAAAEAAVVAELAAAKPCEVAHAAGEHNSEHAAASCGDGSSATASTNSASRAYAGRCAATPPPLRAAAVARVAEAESCGRVGSLSSWLDSPLALADCWEAAKAVRARKAAVMAAAAAASATAFAAGSAAGSEAAACGPVCDLVTGAPAGKAPHIGGGALAADGCGNCDVREAEVELDGTDVPPAPGTQPPTEDGSIAALMAAAAAGSGAHVCVAIQPPLSPWAAAELQQLPLGSPTPSVHGASGALQALAQAADTASEASDVPTDAGIVAACLDANAAEASGSAAAARAASGDVDLAAASAAHVSCSPEEAWRSGCVVVEGVDGGEGAHPRPDRQHGQGHHSVGCQVPEAQQGSADGAEDDGGGRPHEPACGRSGSGRAGKGCGSCGTCSAAAGGVVCSSASATASGSGSDTSCCSASRSSSCVSEHSDGEAVRGCGCVEAAAAAIEAEAGEAESTDAGARSGEGEADGERSGVWSSCGCEGDVDESGAEGFSFCSAGGPTCAWPQPRGVPARRSWAGAAPCPSEPRRTAALVWRSANGRCSGGGGGGGHTSGGDSEDLTPTPAGAATASGCGGAVGLDNFSFPVCRPSCDGAQHSGSNSRNSSTEDSGNNAAAAVAPTPTEWDTGLHLPLWISSNERLQIEKRLDGWVDALLRMGADVEGLARSLSKPLRPLWITQSSTIWVDQVAQPDSLPFTPLYLVSASQPHSYVRQAVVTVSSGGGSAGGRCESGIGSGGSSSTGRRSGGGCAGGSDADGDSSDGIAAVGRSSGDGRAKHHVQKQQHHHQRRGGRRRRHSCDGGAADDAGESQPHAWTYMYVPGAGDDEESWAAGLTPAVFWAHQAALLAAGPAGVHDAVQKILADEQTALAEHGENSTVAGGGAAAAAAAHDYVAPTDAHHLLPAGCRAAAGGAVAVAGPGGLWWLGGTRIALGDFAAGAAPGCWQHVDAVLSVGGTQHPSMSGEAGQEALAVWAHTLEERAQRERHHPHQPAQVQAHGGQHAQAVQGQDEQELAGGQVEGQVQEEGQAPGPQREHLEEAEPAGADAAIAPAGAGSSAFTNAGAAGGAAESSDDQGFTFPPLPLPLPLRPAGDSVSGDPFHCARLNALDPAQETRAHLHLGHYHHDHAQHQHHHHHHHGHHRHVPRYLHLPIQHFKHHRTSLLDALEPALRFLSHHLSRGHTVLIHDINGLDTCVCVAVALLLACYSPTGTSSNGPITSTDADGACATAAAAEDACGLAWAQSYKAGRGVSEVTKDSVRQRLAWLSAHYPAARPTRGMLRQVFNHFVRQTNGASGDGDAD
ncbi:hypothetical protein HYH02_008795 [Chlamydomonas schloesseri]|uniref:Rit1 N-terminal domain-containing protein n=1 Tax=Chlamydomonas schloesseri TaxID=2026947 RepID=A0A836B2F6_9CHLO|nr:hypothetical protein HYH02_008795 [Chlamydomonas schloesseri]|eukprot:KAG2445329.1 hypothetical protein HYH02_008795 [Chlamydomonas schloesseri]